jgi:hypothetical protein
MVCEWVEDPNIPFDPVNPINHCALFLIACKFIPARSKLCWYYPMVHQVPFCIICFAQVILVAVDSENTFRETEPTENSQVQETHTPCKSCIGRLTLHTLFYLCAIVSYK